MQSIGYYAFDDTENLRIGHNSCSVASSKLPLEVNCAGCFFDRLLIFLARRVANGGRDDRLLAASLRYIHSSYHTEIKVPELAKIERLSVSRYNTVFRKIMGTSPIEYVTKMRLSSACELLGNTDLSVKEIGLLVGYTDPHFFSRVFKSHMGVSPAVYRSAGKGMGGDRNEI